jgi:hypothetical protein
MKAQQSCQEQHPFYKNMFNPPSRPKEDRMGNIDDQIFGKVSGDMDPLKKILAKIPGFSGYMERQARRDSDKLLRDMIFQRFRELERRVSGLQREFIEHGEIQYVGKLEASALQLRTFADRIRTATRGYSSLFSAVKINEAELAQLYEYDAALLDKVDEVDRAIGHVQASVGTDGLPAALRNLENVTGLALEALNRREEIVTVQG